MSLQPYLQVIVYEKITDQYDPELKTIDVFDEPIPNFLDIDKDTTNSGWIEKSRYNRKIK